MDGNDGIKNIILAQEYLFYCDSRNVITSQNYCNILEEVKIVFCLALQQLSHLIKIGKNSATR